MSNLTKYLTTVIKHRRYVRQACFKMGIPFLGIVHDLSKFSLKEMAIAKYYDGKRSPHEVVREQLGYSPFWQYHYHKNKHHWQYWLDIEDYPNKIMPAKMPYKYLIEMFCDMVGAGKAYSQKKWTCHDPLNYYKTRCEGKRLMHKDSEEMLLLLFIKLDELGEKEFYKWYRNNFRKGKRT